MPRTLQLAYPFSGYWLVQNSPADRVPSHGTRMFASSYAIDFVPVMPDGRSTRVTVATLVRPEPPERFPAFGRAVLAPVGGDVVAVVADEPDHAAYRGLPSVAYALTQSRRAAAGWRGLAGNCVPIRTADALVVALCHLRRGSITVVPGDAVRSGQPIAQCGNSGNSTEPHLHLQAMTDADVERATAVAIAFGDGLPRDRTVVHAASPTGARDGDADGERPTTWR